MTFNVTLITPPDIFQNNQRSVLFIDISEDEQDNISKWLATQETDEAINIYFYQGENNADWLLYALSTVTYCYIELNNVSAITSYFAGYIISKPNVFYSTTSVEVGKLYSKLNVNCVSNAVDFMERTVGGK